MTDHTLSLMTFLVVSVTCALVVGLLLSKWYIDWKIVAMIPRFDAAVRQSSDNAAVIRETLGEVHSLLEATRDMANSARISRKETNIATEEIVPAIEKRTKEIQTHIDKVPERVVEKMKGSDSWHG